MLVAADKEGRNKIPQNERSKSGMASRVKERSYAGIRCRGIEEREPRIQESNYASNHISSRNGEALG